MFEDRLSFSRAVEAKSEMIRIYGMKDWQIRIIQGYNNVEALLLFACLFKNSAIIKNEMKRLGFFCKYVFMEEKRFNVLDGD